MRITSKGQVTIPQDIREQCGFLPNTEVQFEVKGNNVLIRRVQGRSRRGRDLIRRMKGRATLKLSTAEIMRLTRS